jgi:hypothetical protein
MMSGKRGMDLVVLPSLNGMGNRQWMKETPGSQESESHRGRNKKEGAEGIGLVT